MEKIKNISADENLCIITENDNMKKYSIGDYIKIEYCDFILEGIIKNIDVNSFLLDYGNVILFDRIKKLHI